MNTFDLSSKIADTLSAKWSDFETKHPALAGVIDQSLLVHTAATSMKNDADFQTALTAAKTAGVGQAIGQEVVQTVLPLVEQYVINFLEKLI